ncbi:Methyltransferase domain protein [Roseovarius gaetbuli]|uniref:Methyltransferase domain protein n=1 Tax=Roseovarius gaetbuli TaxID=1356575 RepID=A0A1X6YF30_9RHOB|nr:class I SAM-dependent methyltransferase [Roseovarius gaetbuli]SLN19052.1 Methyltransferase domain protein [Roseovarius gaetbuli]
MTVMENGVAGFMGDGLTMMANRTQARHALLVDAFRHAIADSTVMLIGAEDGAWCYALAAAGGLQVVGIEKNADQVERFMRLPDVGLRERIDMRCADPLEELRSEVDAGRQYDVVILFDMLDSVTDLYELFGLLGELGPHLVIVDGLFGQS